MIVCSLLVSIICLAIGFWPNIVPGMDFILWSGPEIKSEVASYSSNVYSAVVPVAMSDQACHYWSLQSSQLSKTGDYFSPLTACIALWELARRDDASMLILAWYFLYDHLCGVFSNRVLPLHSGRKPGALAIAFIVWGSLGISLTHPPPIVTRSQGWVFYLLAPSA